MKLGYPHRVSKNEHTLRRAFSSPENKPVPVDVKTILRAIGDHDRARALVFTRFDPALLNRWHERPVQERMCDALTYAEDRIEFDEAGRTRPYDSRDRTDLRNVRRRLEWYLWP
jgi:hypothetical protein